MCFCIDSMICAVMPQMKCCWKGMANTRWLVFFSLNWLLNSLLGFKMWLAGTSKTSATSLGSIRVVYSGETKAKNGVTLNWLIVGSVGSCPNTLIWDGSIPISSSTSLNAVFTNWPSSGSYLPPGKLICPGWWRKCIARLVKITCKPCSLSTKPINTAASRNSAFFKCAKRTRDSLWYPVGSCSWKFCKSVDLLMTKVQSLFLALYEQSVVTNTFIWKL